MSKGVSSINDRVRADYQKHQEKLEATRRQAKELEQLLATVRARETELFQAIVSTQIEVSLTDKQAQLASALMLSLEEEQRRKAILSKEEIKAEVQERTHHDKAEKIKALEDQIKKVGNLL